MAWPKTVVLLAALGIAACTPTQPPGNEAPPSASTVDEQALLGGDAALKRKLDEALAAKGPGYRPRTKHKLADGTPIYTNRLILESSPYLLQHAHNPVHWFPWGDEAFALAAKLGRPVFLSVGYATCHWCHVMEEESFEDEAIARYINEHYVPIKVDREERPDVDAVYMRAVQLLTGRGGWPMSLWLTPDRKPFYAGTYFPPRDGVRGAKKGFLTLLTEQRKLFAANPDGVAADARELAERIARDMRPPAASELPDASVIDRSVALAKKRYDERFGGPKGAPKFPSNFPTRLLLRHARRAADDQTRDMALTTLRKMSLGGIYDHVGGGFHRYAVDARWLIPHFEKMLYDNALLSVAYLEGYQQSGDEALARVVRETLDYVIREMTHPKGGYYSATDADSLAPSGHREEGHFFTWTPVELVGVLGKKKAHVVERYFGMSAAGNFEGRNVLHRPRPDEDVAKELDMSVEELKGTIDEAVIALRKAREKRPRPLRDDKIQTSWNGLMISAMARAGLVLDESRYLDSARKAADFLLTQLVVEGRLRHSRAGGQVSALAFAEDHAFLAAGLLDLFEATGELRWLKQAIARMNQLEAHHLDEARGGYYRTADESEKLLAREVETRDGAVPASSSVALMNQLRLATLTTDARWTERAKTTMRAFASILDAKPWMLDEMVLAIDYHTDSAKEIALVLPKEGAKEGELKAMRDQLRKQFLPNRVLVVTPEAPDPALTALAPWIENKTAKSDRVTAYVCRRGACELPTTDPAVFARQIAKSEPYPSPAAKDDGG